MSAETPTKGCEVIVIENKAAIRNVLTRSLQVAGFVVWEAASGEEGVMLFRQHAATIGLVLLDARLGEMDGIQTALELRAIRPDAVLGFMTGDPDSPTMQEAYALSPAFVLEKPFRMAQFLQGVNRILPSPCALQAGIAPLPRQLDYQQTGP